MIRRMILRLLYPLTLLLGKIGVHRRIQDEQFDLIKNLVMPGDILLSRKKFELSNLFIPGKYKHASLLIMSDIIIEATGDGVKFKSLASFLFDKDHICLLRLKNLNTDELACMKMVGQKIHNKPYDYYFENSEKAFYCSELIYYLLKSSCQFFQTFTLRKSLGVDTVIPNDFYLATKYFDNLGEF